MLSGTVTKIDSATGGMGWKIALFCLGALSAIGLFYVRDVPRAQEWDQVVQHVQDSEPELALVKDFVRRTEAAMQVVNDKLDKLSREVRAENQQSK